MRNLNAIEPGVFYPLEDGHVLTSCLLKPGVLTYGIKYSTTSMIEVTEVLRDNELVGWYFFSPFKIECKGGYLITYMESRRGKATNGRVVLRHPEFIVFDIDRCGSLVVSMRVGPELENILMEQ